MRSVILGPATLYLGDAAIVVPTLDDVDLLATDPPWNVAYESSYRRASSFGVIHGDRGEVDVNAILRQSVDKLRRNRHAYVFGPSKLITGIEKLTTVTELTWDKELIGMGDLSLPWGKSHEPIQFAVAVHSKSDRAAGRGALAARLRQGSVLRGMRANGVTSNRHPHEKSLAVMRRLIEASSNIDDVVLDPFMGSGSTVVAALVEGRCAIGVEIDERYFDLACERVSRILPTLKMLESA